jgi:transposase-like protein
MDILEEVDGDIAQRFGAVMRTAREHRSAPERLRIVEERFAGKMSVEAVARRNRVSRGQLNEWRRALRDSIPAAVGWKRFSAKRALIAPEMPQFAAVKVAKSSDEVMALARASSLAPQQTDRPDAQGAPSSATGGASQIEIICCSGCRVMVGADVDAAALARVMDVLER